MDLERFELSTSSMPWKRAPNCATGPRGRVYVPRIAQWKYSYLEGSEQYERIWSFLSLTIDYRRHSSGKSDDYPSQPAGRGHLGDGRMLSGRMNEIFSEVSVPRKEVSLSCSNLRGGELAGVNPVALDELAHELRQPLSVIESLAYFLELTASEERIRGHLQRIQAMVVQANRILERTSSREIVNH